MRQREHMTYHSNKSIAFVRAPYRCKCLEGVVLQYEDTLVSAFAHRTYPVVGAQVVNLLIPYRRPQILAHKLDALESVVHARLSLPQSAM